MANSRGGTPRRNRSPALSIDTMCAYSPRRRCTGAAHIEAASNRVARRPDRRGAIVIRRASASKRHDDDASIFMAARPKRNKMARLLTSALGRRTGCAEESDKLWRGRREIRGCPPIRARVCDGMAVDIERGREGGQGTRVSGESARIYTNGGSTVDAAAIVTARKGKREEREDGII